MRLSIKLHVASEELSIQCRILSVWMPECYSCSVVRELDRNLEDPGSSSG